MSRATVGQAFLREFSVSDFDGSDSNPVTLSFVAVPATLQVTPGSGERVATQSIPTFLRSNFRLDVTGVDGSRVSKVRGIRMSAAKLLVSPQTGSRRQFQAGPPQFEDIQIEMAAFGGSTAADFDQWAGQVAQSGAGATRHGSLSMLSPNLSTEIGAVEFVDLLPLTFPPYFTGDPSRRTMTLEQGQFQLPLP
jgi:hypothetical protein